MKRIFSILFALVILPWALSGASLQGIGDTSRYDKQLDNLADRYVAADDYGDYDLADKLFRQHQDMIDRARLSTKSKSVLEDLEYRAVWFSGYHANRQSWLNNNTDADGLAKEFLDYHKENGHLHDDEDYYARLVEMYAVLSGSAFVAGELSKAEDFLQRGKKTCFNYFPDLADATYWYVYTSLASMEGALAVLKGNRDVALQAAEVLYQYTNDEHEVFYSSSEGNKVLAACYFASCTDTTRGLTLLRESVETYRKELAATPDFTSTESLAKAHLKTALADALSYVATFSELPEEVLRTAREASSIMDEVTSVTQVYPVRSQQFSIQLVLALAFIRCQEPGKAIEPLNKAGQILDDLAIVGDYNLAQERVWAALCHVLAYEKLSANDQRVAHLEKAEMLYADLLKNWPTDLGNDLYLQTLAAVLRYCQGNHEEARKLVEAMAGKKLVFRSWEDFLQYYALPAASTAIK